MQVCSPEVRKWQSTPVFLPGEFHRQRSLVDCSSQGHKESDTTEWTHIHVLQGMFMWDVWAHVFNLTSLKSMPRITTKFWNRKTKGKGLDTWHSFLILQYDNCSIDTARDVYRKRLKCIDFVQQRELYSVPNNGLNEKRILKIELDICI